MGGRDLKFEKPGIYYDVPAEDYFADPCPDPSLTQSIAKVLIEKSPAHARYAHPRLKPKGRDDDEKFVRAQSLGSVAHSLMLGRGKDIVVCDFDAWRTKDAKAKRAEAIDAGKVPVLTADYELAGEMVEAATAQLTGTNWKKAFQDGDGQGEVAIAWVETGIWFRSLIDWLPKDQTVLYDYKTTGMSVSPYEIPRMMVNMGWDVQAAFHERGLAQLHPELAGKMRFRFIVQENTPPFAIIPVELPPAAMTMGRKKVDYAARLWRRCVEFNQWPGYAHDVCLPEYPGWAESRWLEREIIDHEKEIEWRNEPEGDLRGTISSLMGG